MAADRGIELVDWTVEYDLPAGKTMPAAVTIPHAWRQEVDVRWEGPAIYRCAVDLPEDAWLVFEGVSYQARVFVQNIFAGEHRGIWDAFVIDVRKWSGQSVVIRVEVVKNGGGTFPVREVLSGFLPYVFHTFGGIYKPVRVVSSIESPFLTWEGGVGDGGWATASLSALVEAEEIADNLDFEAPFPPLPLGRGSVNEENTGVGLIGDQGVTPPPAPSPRGGGMPSRIRADGSRLFVDGKPLFVRGVLTWGWYPELGHQNPDLGTIRKEIAAAKELGFNLIKFCLWIPPHEFLEEMNKEGLFAWIELPLWDPSSDPEKLAFMRDEIERIVAQYRRHSNVIFWTCGCELSDATSAEFRKELVETVKELTGCPMVKDNSGGAEMYGGDPREFGSFDDFHPYCDLPFYPQVLASLAANATIPILLGEFNDYDCARDLETLRAKRPYWTSSDPALNDMGVRWQLDFPRVLDSLPRSAEPESVEINCVERSRSKANFIRERVEDAVRSHDAIVGYVVTGWIDTPISTSGFLDESFNEKGLTLPNGNSATTSIFPIPLRRPPWVHGGNRPGWQDFANRWVGPNVFRLGVRSAAGGAVEARCRLLDMNGHELVNGSVEFETEPSKAIEIQFDANIIESGFCRLVVEARDARYERPIHCYVRPDWSGNFDGRIWDRENFLIGLQNGIETDILATDWSPELVSEWKSGSNIVLFATGAMTLPMPFWRECVHECHSFEPWLRAFAGDIWEQILPVSTDRALDRSALETAIGAQGDALLSRIDTRTYAEHPFAMEFDDGRSKFIVTTLRPFGGLGWCPLGVQNNPAGSQMLFDLLQSFQQS